MSGAALAGERNLFVASVAGLRTVCEQPPATACADRVISLFDADGNRKVSRREFEAIRLMARAAVRQHPADISGPERGMIAIALFALESAGSGVVFTGFDGDGDGHLVRAEMFADFRLDKRSFSDVVADPGAVDWQTFAERFGKSGSLFLPLLTAARDR